MSKKNRSRRVNPYNANRRLPTTLISFQSPKALKKLNTKKTITELTRYTNKKIKQLRAATRKVQQKKISRPPFNPLLMQLSPAMYINSLRESLKADTEICARRHQRAEVLHALNKTGKSGQKKPKYTAESKIRCERKK